MAQKIYPYELIGQEIEVINSKNKSNLGLKGKIVDETKYSLKVFHRGKIKTLMKNNLTLRLKKTGQTLEGKSIAKRPEERVKGK